MNASRLAQRPLRMVLGALAGLAAGFVFDRTWRALAHSDHVPRALDEGHGWSEVLLAAALQGAVFAAVKAAVDRASAVGVRRFTGSWPG